MKVRDLIYKALRLINAVAYGEQLSAEHGQDGLSALNDLLDLWSIQRLLINGSLVREVTFTDVLTVGPGAALDIPTVVRIDQITHNDCKVRIVDDFTWAELNHDFKGVSDVTPTHIWDDAAAPIRTLRVYPETFSPVTLKLYMWSALSNYASLDDDVVGPPGWHTALRYNLAMLLAPEFNMPTPPEVAAIADDSRAWLKRINAPELILDGRF